MSADGQRVLTIDGHEAKICDVATGKELVSFKGRDAQSEFPATPLPGGSDDGPDVRRRTLSDNGQVVVSWVASSFDRVPPPSAVKVYDAETWLRSVLPQGTFWPGYHCKREQ